jgi:type I restriction enzyme S subunit
MSGVADVALGDVASVVRTTIEPGEIREGAFYVGLENITPGGAFNSVAKLRSGEVVSTKFVFSENEVLFGKLRPYLAKIARPDFGGVCSTDILPIAPGPRLDRDYLAHFLSRPAVVALAAQRATGANLPRLSPRELERFRLPLPSLREQKRIARVLDAADGLRVKRREALVRLGSLTESIFKDTFEKLDTSSGSETVLLRDAYWFQEGPGVRKWQFRDAGVKLLNVANILKDGTLDLEKTNKYLGPDEVQSRYEHFLVDEGDLVVASSGISFDDDGMLRTRGAFVDTSHLPLCMNTSTIRFKAIEGLSNLAYLKQWLETVEFRSQISRRVTGSAQQNFGPSHLRELWITLPPIHTQQLFDARVAGVGCVRAVQQTHLAHLDTLFTSLQDRAFKGEL